MLFSNKRKLTLSIPIHDDAGAPTNVAYLVRHLCDNVMKDPRKDMFVLDGTVCVQYRQTIAFTQNIRLTPLDDLAFSYSSTMPIGSSKEKRNTRFRRATISSSFPRSTEARR
jgi:hypothetical protein